MELVREPILATGSPLSECIRLRTAAELPEWARGLLSHDRDMTSTLEAFHGRSIHIRALETDTLGEVLVRQVVLETNAGEPVEFGAIRIHLDRFDTEARGVIENGRVPLGSVLDRFGLEYTCRPSRFFEIVDVGLAEAAFGVHYDGALYGRQNTIFDEDERVMAEVVEVLAPQADE